MGLSARYLKKMEKIATACFGKEEFKVSEKHISNVKTLERVKNIFREWTAVETKHEECWTGKEHKEAGFFCMAKRKKNHNDGV